MLEEEKGSVKSSQAIDGKSVKSGNFQFDLLPTGFLILLCRGKERGAK